MPRPTKSLWEITSQASIVAPDGDDKLLFAPQPGVLYQTECAGMTIAQLATEIQVLLTVANGSYNPVVTPIANLASAIAGAPFQFMRVGNVVTVSGILVVELTAAGAPTALELTCPVVPVFDSAGDAGGAACIQDANGNAAGVSGDIVSNRLRVEWVASAGISISPATHGMPMIATYIIA